MVVIDHFRLPRHECFAFLTSSRTINQITDSLLSRPQEEIKRFSHLLYINLGFLDVQKHGGTDHFFRILPSFLPPPFSKQFNCSSIWYGSALMRQTIFSEFKWQIDNWNSFLFGRFWNSGWFQQLSINSVRRKKTVRPSKFNNNPTAKKEKTSVMFKLFN